MKRIIQKENWAYFLFWTWNLIFLAFMGLGFAPQLLPDMIEAVQRQVIPAAFVVYAVTMTLIPLAAVVLGLTIFRLEPGKLLALGYGVEAPLMLILVIRFFLVRQATPSVALLLGAAGLGILCYLWWLFDSEAERALPLSLIRLLGLTLLLATGLYACLWLAFYALPLGAEIPSLIGNMADGLVYGLRNGDLRFLPLTFFGTILGAYSATLFLFFPIVVPLLYGHAWVSGLRRTAKRGGTPLALGLSLTTAVVLMALMLGLNRQPQAEAFALLETPPATEAEALALLEHEDLIRRGLLNSYLAPQRYISARGEVRHVSDMYTQSLNMDYQRAAQVQALYEGLAQPLLYDPVTELSSYQRRRWENSALRTEPAEAAKLYQQYFDSPLVEAEEEAVSRAVRSTWSVDQAFTGWQQVSDREIHLLRQELTVAEQGDWAEMELYEVYQNQTGQRQEVVYYFSLPESAVITGVWLGHTADRDSRFVYHVAPRGAAQATYRNEVRRNMDPALVEQIGPGQYRLRVFPVEPVQQEWQEEERNTIFRDGPPLHMWLTWRVLAEDGRWPMPYLAQKWNVYWDRDTVRLLNGAEPDVLWKQWLPESLPATTAAPAVAHRVDFADGTSLLAQPASAQDAPPAADLRLAVVVDRSRSMADLETQTQAALDTLQASGAAVELYLTSSPYRGEGPARMSMEGLNPEENLLAFGGQNPAALLAQFEQLRGAESYDAVLVLTDGTGYELGQPEVAAPVMEQPLWMVHLDGQFPIGYDDSTLEAIQASGGGAAASVEEALARLTAAREPGLEGLTVNLVDGYRWLAGSAEQIEALSPPDAVRHDPAGPFAALAARQLILTQMMAQRQHLDSLDNLDALHALAVDQSIVTPYSSMIVLVTSQQEQLLKRLEGQADRFDREFEELGDTTGQNALTVTGVPEPEEWLLIIMGLALLGWYLYTSPRRKLSLGNG